MYIANLVTLDMLDTIKEIHLQEHFGDWLLESVKIVGLRLQTRDALWPARSEGRGKVCRKAFLLLMGGRPTCRCADEYQPKLGPSTTSDATNNNVPAATVT
jgi:hypothetical protein